MAINRKNKEKQDVQYNVKVRRAHEFKSGDIGFDIDVNGIALYGLTYLDVNPEKNLLSYRSCHAKAQTENITICSTFRYLRRCLRRSKSR